MHCRRYERLIQAAFWDLVGRPLVGEIDLASHAGWENKALPDIKVHALRRYNAWVSRKAVPESRASWGRLAIINAELPHESPDTNVFGAGSLPGLCGALRWRGTNRWLLRKRGVRLDPPSPRQVLHNMVRGAYARLALAGQWRVVRWLTDGARTAAWSR